jgi:hypothetical protein
MTFHLLNAQLIRNWKSEKKAQFLYQFFKKASIMRHHIFFSIKFYHKKFKKTENKCVTYPQEDFLFTIRLLTTRQNQEYARNVQLINPDQNYHKKNQN